MCLRPLEVVNEHCYAPLPSTSVSGTRDNEYGQQNRTILAVIVLVISFPHLTAYASSGL